MAKIQKILRHRHDTTTNRYLESLGFQLEEIQESMEVLAGSRPRLSLCTAKKVKPSE